MLDLAPGKTLSSSRRWRLLGKNIETRRQGSLGATLKVNKKKNATNSVNIHCFLDGRFLVTAGTGRKPGLSEAK